MVSDRDPELSASPMVLPQRAPSVLTPSAMTTMTTMATVNEHAVAPSPESQRPPHCQVASVGKPWKQQFIDRIHIEKNWRQGKAQSMTLIGHNGSVTDLKFDEYRLVTCSDDGSIILWHLDSMKKWKPKSKGNAHHDRTRKQLERGDDAEQRYTFFPTKEERKADAHDEEPHPHDDEHGDAEHERKHEDSGNVPGMLERHRALRVDTEPEVFARAPKSSQPSPPILSQTEDDNDSDSSSVSTSQLSESRRNSDSQHAAGSEAISMAHFQLNNLYHLNENWNMNDTKLSAWRHSFVTSFGSAFRNRLTMLKPGRARRHSTKTLVADSRLLQNHHYSKDLNFKRLSFQGHGGPIWAIDFDHELLVSGSYDKCIKIWNILNGNCRATLRGHDEWVSGVRLRHKYIMSCSWDASIRLWKLDETRFGGKCIATLQSQSGNAIYSVEWSADRNFVVSGCRSQAVQVWDLRKTQMIKTFMGHTKEVYCVKMSNNLVLSGSADRTIKMWDPRTAGCLATFTESMGAVIKLQFDDHKLISAGYDKQVRIFDLRARKQLHSLSGHSKGVLSLQYDHKKIITGSVDKRVLVWNFD